MRFIIFQHTLLVPKFVKRLSNKSNLTQTPLHNIPKNSKKILKFLIFLKFLKLFENISLITCHYMKSVYIFYSLQIHN